MKSYKSVFLPIIFALLLVIGILIGNWYGSNFKGSNLSLRNLFDEGGRFDKDSPDVNFSLFPRANKLNSVITYIQNEYVDTVNIDKIAESAIPALLEELDPHSLYIPAVDLKKYNEPLIGNFSGIGVQFNMTNDTVAIIHTIPNGPSQIVGIQAGDRIIKVNGIDVSGVKLLSDSVVKKLKGPRGTIVHVTIIRKGVANPLEFDITRDDIPLYSVDVAYMINENTGFIKISAFSQSTYDEFMDAVNKLHNQGMKNLILDLRGNGGGIMDASTRIADEILDNKLLIVYTQGRARSRSDIYSSPGGACTNDKIAILIDEYSASASEILAGAIQDNDRGTIIGRRSFGKGLVQEQIQFRDGSAIRLSIARYYTPTGRSIQKPYEGGTDNYYRDLSERFNHGEFINADSIQFADSLEFVTPAGKIVYGGGGIMPDIFIPMDTSQVSGYYTKVTNLGLIYRFAFDYSDKNRKILNKFSSAADISNYLDKSGCLKEFIKYAELKDVPVNEQDLKISQQLIKVQLKAYIARNILDNEGFYPIISEIDNTLGRAIALFE